MHNIKIKESLRGRVITKILIILFLNANILLALAEDDNLDNSCANYTDANQKAACENFLKQYRVPTPPPEPAQATTQTAQSTANQPAQGFRSEQPKFPTMPGIIPAPTTAVSNPLIQPQPPAQNTITPLFNITAPAAPQQRPQPVVVPMAGTPLPSAKQPTKALAPAPTVNEAPSTTKPATPPQPSTRFFDQQQETNQPRTSIYQ